LLEELMEVDLVEERPKLDLSAEEIASREREKAQLLAGIGIPTAEARSEVPRARRGRSRDELAGDYEPPAISVVEPMPMSMWRQQKEDLDRRHVTPAKITADAQELATLMQDAKSTQAEAEAAEEMAESAKTAAINARVRLNEYMREHGLA
jgi:hypothetical protein